MNRFNMSMEARELNDEGKQAEMEELADKLRESRARIISEREEEVS